MRCPQVQKLISTATDGELDEVREQAAKAHLAKCEECRQFAADLAEVGKAFAGWIIPEPRPGFTSRMMDRLSQTPTEQPWFREWIAALRPLTAAAAMLALFCGAAMAYTIQSSQSSQQSSDESSAEVSYAEPFELVSDNSVGDAYLTFLQEME